MANFKKIKELLEEKTYDDEYRFNLNQDLTKEIESKIEKLIGSKVRLMLDVDAYVISDIDFSDKKDEIHTLIQQAIENR